MVYLSDPPFDENDTPQDNESPRPVSQEKKAKNRIMIIEERDIPFLEERPPNLSPNYEVKVHRTQRKGSKEASED